MLPSPTPSGDEPPVCSCVPPALAVCNQCKSKRANLGSSKFRPYMRGLQPATCGGHCTWGQPGQGCCLGAISPLQRSCRRPGSHWVAASVAASGKNKSCASEPAVCGSREGQGRGRARKGHSPGLGPCRSQGTALNSNLQQTKQPTPPPSAAGAPSPPTQHWPPAPQTHIRG
jgi:hypothetical protein